MTSEVQTATRDATLEELGRLLMSQKCHHVPIVDDSGRPIGMVSSGDLIDAAHRLGMSSFSPEAARSSTAGDVMSSHLETIYVDQTVDRAIERIGQGDIHSLVVLDHDDALAGIVTHRDLLRYLMG